MSDVLIHYGVVGMKWGVRRTPEQLGHKILKKAKTANLEKWGKDAEHNVLYVTGRSGGGKSTLSQIMADSKTDIIHLDLYFELSDNELGFGDDEVKSKEFDDFLKKTGVKAPGNFPNGSEEQGESLNNFEKAVDAFGKEQFKKGRKVIAEGVQVADDGLFMDKTYYKDKPVIIGQSSELKSSIRAMKRDTGGVDLSYLARRVKDSGWMDQYLNDFETITNAKRSSQWVKNYLKEESK